MLVHERFWQRARSDPDLDAFVDVDGETLTYGQVARKVGNLARNFAKRLEPATRVAINTRKSARPVLTMLASLSAGLTYVPVDPASPVQRRRFVLEDSGARALVLDDATAAAWREAPDALEGLPLDLIVGADPGTGAGDRAERADFEELTAGDGRLEPADPDLDQLAYILYTSGSTGQPKGVAITHRNAAAFVDWALDYTGLRPGDRVAVHAPLHFDLPVLDLYAGFGGGATVCPVGERTALFPQALYQFLRERRITALYAVPSALIAMHNRSTLASEGLPDLRLLLYAGEEFHPGPLRRLVAALPGVEVHNLYGPIETNVITALRISEEHLDLPRIPIGRPVASTHLMLLDSDGKVVDEPDREGEIVAAGPSTTPGYLNRPDLTAKARAKVEHDGRAWDCHRTGDYATWDPSGILRFLGRRDGLVKTRGYRVELGEIEAALLDHDQVVEAAVVAVPHPDHTNLIHGFAIPEPGDQVDESALLAWLKQRLAPYMVPARIELRDDFPRTSTGKISRRDLREALLDSDGQTADGHGRAADNVKEAVTT